MPQRVKVIVWNDVLVLCDAGRSVVEDYEEISAIGLELKQTYRNGFGLLNIIPENAVPPSEAVRAAINRAIERAERSLRGVSWCIEEALSAAMVRAVLTGMRFLPSATYPRHVSTRPRTACRGCCSGSRVAPPASRNDEGGRLHPKPSLFAARDRALDVVFTLTRLRIGALHCVTRLINERSQCPDVGKIVFVVSGVAVQLLEML